MPDDVPALLLVLSDPGDQVTEAEFHDWYDNEHIPLRVDTPAFKSWRRAKAIDPKWAPWVAFYDLTSYEDTQKRPYTTLAETRSEREKSVLSRLKLLDRRLYELRHEAPIHAPSPSFNEKEPSPYVAFIFADIPPEKEEDFNRWYEEEHIPLLSKVPGWLRGRRFVLKESQRFEGDVQVTGKPAPKYLHVIEWEHLEGRESEEYKHATSTPWRERVVGDMINAEKPIYEHYKAWARV